MFKLLALKVSPGCADYIRKCLKNDIYYYFCKDFRFDISGKVYRGSKHIQPLPQDFFAIPVEDEPNTKDALNPTININAIVGKNGDGKSTIVEIIMRLVNNYIVLHPQSQGNPEARTLLEVKDVYAELYFQVDDGIYVLQRIRNEHGVFKIATITDSQSFEIMHEPAPQVFSSIYTFVSNYSHYAYNVYDFRNEWDRYLPQTSVDEENEACWLFHIFHKNDGYATPISLHPYRKSGNIDINNEDRLSRQRLLYLFINSSDSPTSFRHILDTPADNVRFELSKRSKFQDKTLIEHFLRYEKKDTSLEWATNIIEKTFPKLEKNPETLEGDLKTLEENYFSDITNTFDYITACGIANRNAKRAYRAYFFKALDWLKSHYLTKQDYLRDSQQKSNLEIYWKQVYNLSKMAKSKELKWKISMFNRNIYAACRRYNIRQLARLRTIYDIAIANGIDPFICFEEYESLSPADRCRLYVIYKTISIYETYPQYKARISEDIQLSKNGADVCIEYLPIEYEKLQKQLDDDRDAHSHITRKLEQAENYIKEYEKHGNEDFYKRMVTNKKLSLSSSFSVPLDKLKTYYNKRGLRLENLPPAIYDIEIRFRAEKIFGMHTLSSGERQLLSTIGAIIYHLQNIESNGTYQSVNLILEEIELYFHPDYQRKFIQRLISQIHGASLEKIKNVNITFVTHSPFILSDIPKCNVLFLKEGNPDYGMQENTFGANIHSLLKNGFFLPNLPMGEFAYKKINELFRQLNGGDFDHNPENVERLRQEITLVGEPYLREELFKLLRYQ